MYFYYIGRNLSRQLEEQDDLASDGETSDSGKDMVLEVCVLYTTTDMCLPVVVDEEAENEEQEITCSYLPVPHVQAGKEDLIRSAINGENALDWPYMGETSMNEFRTPSLAGMSFPSLFPTGRGYPTDPTRIHAVELSTNWKTPTAVCRCSSALL